MLSYTHIQLKTAIIGMYQCVYYRLMNWRTPHARIGHTTSTSCNFILQNIFSPQLTHIDIINHTGKGFALSNLIMKLTAALTAAKMIISPNIQP